MGSSLSPVLANIYMEHFETELLKDIPVDMKPTLWLRYVDDVFCCYEDMSKFDTFLELLNRVRPSIQFTYELSRIERTTNVSTDSPESDIEIIPFLELNVLRPTSGDFTFSIYRKPCHAENYLHAFSYQPRSHKLAVIRSQSLRAYRYCDIQYLKEEEQHIQQSFLSLGYTPKFIENSRTSAFKGRSHEIRNEYLSRLQELPFAVHMRAPSVKQDPLATLAMTYHPHAEKLRPRLNEMGIRLAFTTNSTLRQQLKHNSTTYEQPKGSVYVVNCKACTDVYIGQTGRQVEDRMSEHSRGPYTSYISDGAICKHNHLRGYEMDL